MKKILHIAIVFVMFVSANTLRAQDFHLSMYDAAPLFLNPAMTGLVDAPWRVHAQYRNQWKAVAFKPYNTALLSFDAPYKKWGFGGQVIEMRAGLGNYNVFQFMGSAAYNVAIDKKRDHQLSFAVQAGFTQKSVDLNKLTFDNQYYNSNGGGFDKSLASGETQSSRSQIIEQVNAGFLYYYAKETSRINPFIGYSAFNITKPKETFFDENNALPIRHYIHTGVRINITEKLYVLPKCLVMMQTTASEKTFAVDASYYLDKPSIYILGGFVYRTKDAAIISIGARKANYIAKICYDVNISSLKVVSANRGAIELSFTYMGNKKRPQSIRNCPRI
jgi:type IX secretion system PorP/SprF family membrane protein